MQVLKEKRQKIAGFSRSQTTNKLVNEAANDSIPPGLAGKIVKNHPLSEQTRLQDLEDSARSQV